MKMFKKLSAVLLASCLMILTCSMAVFAEDCRIQLTDISDGKVGEYMTINCAVKTEGTVLSQSDIVLSYDKEYLGFDSGDGVTNNGDGTLTLTNAGGTTEIRWSMKFQAKKEGSTSIKINSSAITANGANLSAAQGSSSIKIGAGDASKVVEEPAATPAAPATSDMQVEVNGVPYTLIGEFKDTDLPNGYARTTVNLDGEDRNMIINETSGVYLGRLVAADGTPGWFLFDEETAIFYPYAEIPISDTTSIVILSDTSAVSLPENFRQATMTINDQEFPVWQEIDNEGFYVVYATGSDGADDYYHYDASQNTYQRYSVPETEEEDAGAAGLLGKVQDFIMKYVQMIVLVGGIGIVLILFIFLILTVKLHNRNRELDELYEEFGLNDEEPEEKLTKKEKKAQKKAEKAKKKKGRKKDDYDDYDDYEDEYEDDEYEDDFEEEDRGFETSEIGLKETAFETSDFGFETSEIDLGDEPLEEEDFEEEDDDFEEDFAEEASAEADFAEDDFEEGPEEDDFVGEDDLDAYVEDESEEYGGISRTGELTIDDLGELLGGGSGKEEKEEFTVDFIDLD